jgi:hypothetical protein
MKYIARNSLILVLMRDSTVMSIKEEIIEYEQAAVRR